ncbi:MAG: Rha family transcriptional regulator [Ruminococcus sp.]|nr:Rha family transcriptional regulator [Ruminococcus sp.]
MNQITINNSNGKLTVSSLQVAKDFGKQHKHVLEAIENIKAENSAVTKMFIESAYKAGTGKTYKCYEITRDGFSLLVMGFTGKKALEWKLRYIEAFNLMEQKLYSNYYEQLTFENKPEYEYFDKTYNGKPVLTIDDISHIFNVKRQTILYHLGNKSIQRGTDYYVLRAETISAFKRENPKFSKMISSLSVIEKSGFVKLCKVMNINCDVPKCYRIEKKKKPSNQIVADILHDLGINPGKLSKYVGNILLDQDTTITGNSALLHRSAGKSGDMIFFDSSSGKYEKLAIIMQNIGYLLLGGFRESIDGKPILRDEIHNESKIFSAVFLALKMFVDYGGFETNK